MKIFFLLLAITATAIQLAHSATLRRKPKVYNALITTDQNLTPSRAFPVIQPHLQETYAYPSYSYRNYAPLGLYNNGFHQYGSATTSYNGFHHSYPRINHGLVQGRNFFPRDEIHSTLPSTSNDFGLPPLVPINSLSFGNFGNLAPYPYHSYPIIGSVYDHFGGYGGYLPPYSFYPPVFDGINPDKGRKDADDKKDGNGSADGSTGISDDSDGSSGSGGNGGSSASGGSSGPSGSGGNSGSSGSGGNSGSSGSGDNSGSPGSGGNSGSSGSGGNSGSSGSGGNTGSSGSGGNSGSSGSGGNSGSSGSGGNSGSSGSGGGGSSSSTSSNTKSSRSRNFDRMKYPQQQSLSENIKNFPNKDPTIPDINPLPPVRVKALNK